MSVKAYILFDTGWYWEPLVEGTERYARYVAQDPTLEIPEELVAEFNEVAPKFHALMEKLEQLYRVQRGIEPYEGIPVPEHKLLTLEKLEWPTENS